MGSITEFPQAILTGSAVSVVGGLLSIGSTEMAGSAGKLFLGSLIAMY